MCRIAAYIGPTCRLDRFLTAPPHAIARQAWDAREMTEGTVNADGWGAGWFDEDHRPAVYRHTHPIWSDPNIGALGRTLYASTWIANVRSATEGLGTDYANTQPFADDELLFAHNGFIDRFAETLRARLTTELNLEALTAITGNTDSEYLFALLRQKHGTLANRLRAMHDQIANWMTDLPNVRALLNFIVTDGREIVGIRNAVNAPLPSLYYNRDWHGGAVIASEAFDQEAGWIPMPTNEVVSISARHPPQQVA